MIVKDIVERPVAGPSVPRPPQLPTGISKGFPAPRRRLAGARRADLAENSIDAVPSTATTQTEGNDASSSKHRRPGGTSEMQKVRQEVGAENAARVVNMTDEEREGEIAELAERFGGGLLEALKKRAMARSTSTGSQPSIANHSPTRKPSRPDPPDAGDLKGRYFPDVPSEPDKLAWMAPLPSSSSDTSSPRFTLSGQRLSASAQQDLPTHLGLHHHGDAPDLAGYTVDEILHLSRSTVVAQRVIMLDVLAKVLTIYAPVRAQKPDAEVWTLLKGRKALEEALVIALDIVRTSKSVNLIRAAIEVIYAVLGGEEWTMLDGSRQAEEFVPEPTNLDRPSFSSLEMPNLVPLLDNLLSSPDYLPRRSTHLLVRILRRATLASQELAEEVCRLIPHLILTQVVPHSSNSHQSSQEVLRIACDVIASSRRCAEALMGAGILDGLLRYLTPSFRHASSEEGEVSSLAIEVLRIFRAFARYGMGASHAVSAIELFRNLGDRVAESCKGSSSPVETAVVEAYFDLLAVWITCAIDPHKTTPEHDLTWSQISPMGWADTALEAAIALLARGCLGGELRAAMGVLAQWLIGISINEPSRATEEQRKVRHGLASANLRRQLLDALPPFESPSPANDAEFMDTITAAIRIHNLCPMPTDAGFLLGHPPFLSRVAALSVHPGSQSAALHNNALVYELIQAAKRQERIVSRSWTTPARQIYRALGLMTRFRQGEESMALDLLDDMLRMDWSTVDAGCAKLVEQIGNVESLSILRPLLQYTILPKLEDLVAPIISSPQYLKVSTTLLRSAASPPRLGSGLPLSPSWIFSPIDELLRSADSPALAQGPPDWNPSELDIVRATLTFAQIARHVRPACLSAGERILGGMKVYMLEHATSTKGISGGEAEVFRDPVVAELLKANIRSCTSSPPATGDHETQAPSETSKHELTLEEIAKATLHDVPFYQFYTDLLALFEGVSFGDQTFAAYLLPPLSMRYPSDFRKLLWVDHPTAIRFIRTSIADLPVEHRVEDYFDPPEDNAEILRGYARALSRGWVGPSQSALNRIASHHIAHCLWEESTDETPSAKDLRKSVLVTLFAASEDVIRSILRNSSHELSNDVLAEEEVARRKAMVKDLLGEAGEKRVASL